MPLNNPRTGPGIMLAGAIATGRRALGLGALEVAIGLNRAARVTADLGGWLLGEELEPEPIAGRADPRRARPSRRRAHAPR